VSKIKELPYKQGYEAREAGQRTKANPYWENYENGLEWAFHSWLHGWSDADSKILLKELDDKQRA